MFKQLGDTPSKAEEIESPSSPAGDKIRFPFSGPSGAAVRLSSIVQTHTHTHQAGLKIDFG